ncbi:hypothetical protein HYT59_02670 [Candidatus Woesebacteria bacterium]|nr:hypothetical protein [Candidatus Woesebacteria bacterium]
MADDSTKTPKPVVEEVPVVAPTVTVSQTDPTAVPAVTPAATDAPQPPVNTGTPAPVVPPDADNTFGVTAQTSGSGLPPVISATRPTSPYGGGRRVRNFVLGLVGLLFLVGAVGAGVYLVQQQQELREKAAVTTDLAAGLTVTNQHLSTCKSKCQDGNSCRLYVNRYQCDSNNLPRGCQNSNGQALSDNTSVGDIWAFDFSKSCGTQQIDLGCKDDFGTYGNMDFLSYTGPNSCTITDTGDGQQPPPSGCVNCETQATCAQKGGTPTSEQCDLGAAPGLEGIKCNLPASACGAPPSPVCKPEGVVSEKLWCDGNSIPSNESLCQGIDCCYGECAVFNTDDNGQCGKPGCNYPQCGKKVATCGGPPKATATPKPSPTTAQCLNIIVYDTDWNVLDADARAALKPGDKIRVTVSGSATAGAFDQARFTFNGTLRDPVTTKKPNTQEFYDEITIPAGATSIEIKGELHHPDLEWF